MKKIVFAICLLSSFSVFAQPAKGPARSGMYFGKSFVATEAVDINKVAATLTEEPSSVMVEGTVTDVCKAEGCWLKISSEDGPVMVKMMDHAFKVPVSLEGKKVAILGSGRIQETSVDMLRHYAEDAGKSKEEIIAITEPRREVILQAVGIMVK